MKKDPKLRDLLIGTGAVVLLTLFQIFRDQVSPSYRGYREGLELLILWLVVIAVWVVYLIRVIRKGRKDEEEESWNRREKDPW